MLGHVFGRPRIKAQHLIAERLADGLRHYRTEAYQRDQEPMGVTTQHSVFEVLIAF